MSFLASSAILGTEPFDTLRTLPPSGVTVVVGVLVVLLVLTALKKLIKIALLVAVVGGLYLAYRAGTFDSVLSGVLDSDVLDRAART